MRRFTFLLLASALLAGCLDRSPTEPDPGLRSEVGALQPTEAAPGAKPALRDGPGTHRESTPSDPLPDLDGIGEDSVTRSQLGASRP